MYGRSSDSSCNQETEGLLRAGSGLAQLGWIGAPLAEHLQRQLCAVSELCKAGAP
jgi:hypothetical protein